MEKLLRGTQDAKGRAELLMSRATISDILGKEMAGFGEPKIGNKKKAKLDRNKKSQVETLLSSALGCHEKGDFVNAEKRYREAINIEQSNHLALTNLGLTLLQQGKAREAIKPLTAAAALNYSEQCSILLAEAYQSIGKFKEAIKEYNRLDINKSKNKL